MLDSRSAKTKVKASSEAPPVMTGPNVRPARGAGARGGTILGLMPTLAVIGAGPKGIAIAAKARALAAAGLDAPRVVLVDRSAVAGNWSGQQGYTSGLLPLGTPPEKDVGFPYADSWGAASAAVTAAMAEFSWQRHLIATARTPTGSIAAACARRTGSGALPARGRRAGRCRDRRRRGRRPRGRAATGGG